jgi:putative oxidoreductase
MRQAQGFFERHAELGTVILRLFLGGVLVYGTADNVFSSAHMHEFERFLAERGVPFPLAAAYLSAYAQFLCGLLVLAGAATRVAGAIVVLNFIAALLIAHRGAPFQANIAPLAMLSGGLFLLFHGPGPLSVDARRAVPSPPRRGLG